MPDIDDIARLQLAARDLLSLIENELLREGRGAAQDAEEENLLARRYARLFGKLSLTATLTEVATLLLKLDQEMSAQQGGGESTLSAQDIELARAFLLRQEKPADAPA